MADAWRDGEAPRRIAAAQRAMAAEGLDALLVIGGANLTYLSGYPGVERTLARALVLLLPRAGAPCLIVHDFRRHQAAWYSWVEDVRGYSRLSEAPVEAIRGALADRGLTGGRIGAELGYEQRLNLPLAELERLRDALERFELVDAAALLWGLRMRKSPLEIARLRRAGQVTADAYAACFAAARAGMGEDEIALRMRLELVRRAGGDAWVVLGSGRGRYHLAVGFPGPRPVEPGDMVWMDAGCSVGGYWSDYSRAGVVGGASAEQREAQALLQEATAAGVRLVRAGVPVAEIAHACNRRLADLGLPLVANLSDLAGRIGHGIGLEYTEPPHVAEYDPTVLEAGMVISVEPGVATEYGLFHVEENVVVTEEGCQVLSVAPRELWSIAG